MYAMYQLTHDETIIRTADGARIPDDPDNRDYQQYLLWRDGGVGMFGAIHPGGNTPLPADPV